MTAAVAHASSMGAPAELARCPLMPTYGPPSLQLVRGEGSWVWDREGRRYLDLLSGLAVTSLGHSHPAVADALAEQARTLVHVSNLFGTEPGWQVARTLDRLLGEGPGGWGPDEQARAGVLRQQWRRGQRVRHQARPTLRRPWPSRRRQRLWLVPRAHAGDLARHWAADQTRALPAVAGRVPARRLVRPRRPRRSPRSDGGRGAARGRPGRGRREPGTDRLPRGCATAVRRARRAAHLRRGADGPRSLRRLVRPPGLGCAARCGDDGQGAGQRRPDRRLLGTYGGGCRLRARRSRHHLRRPAAGHRRRQGRAGGDGGRGRARLER